MHYVFHMKTRVCVKYFVNVCFSKQFLASKSPQTISNLICLTTFETPRPLAQFLPKIRATNLQKSTKICITWIQASRYFKQGTNLVLKAFQVWSRTFFQEDRVSSCQNMTVLTINKSC